MFTLKPLLSPLIQVYSRQGDDAITGGFVDLGDYGPEQTATDIQSGFKVGLLIAGDAHFIND